MTVAARVSRKLGVGRARDAVLRRYSGSIAEDFARRLKALRFITTITMFGATFLLSALPLIILVSAIASRRVEDDLAHHLGLNAHAAQSVRLLFRHPAQQSPFAVTFAVALTLAGTVGVAGLVQTSYEQIFGQPHRHRGNLLRWLLWSLALCAWFAVASAVSALTSGLPGHLVLDALCVLLASVAFFWWSMHLLLIGRVPWRRLLVPALVTAVFWLVLEIVAALYFSATITSDSRLYGTIGVVFSLLTWFIWIDAVVVLGALAGDVVQSRRRPAAETAPPATADAEVAAEGVPVEAGDAATGPVP